MLHRIEVFKETSDNFSPSIKVEKSHLCKTGYLVKVSFHGNIASPKETPCFRVSVCGLDDTGFDRDFDNEIDAYLLFLDTLRLEDVTIKIIRGMGFKPF